MQQRNATWQLLVSGSRVLCGKIILVALKPVELSCGLGSTSENFKSECGGSKNKHISNRKKDSQFVPFSTNFGIKILVVCASERTESECGSDNLQRWVASKNFYLLSVWALLHVGTRLRRFIGLGFQNWVWGRGHDQISQWTHWLVCVSSWCVGVVCGGDQMWIMDMTEGFFRMCM